MGLKKIESKRTFKEIITVALVETHHWQLLCDLANNDYDISYIGGKVTIADNLVTFLRGVEDEFYLQEVVEYLYNELTEVTQDYEETYKGEDYNIHNEIKITIFLISKFKFRNQLANHIIITIVG